MNEIDDTIKRLEKSVAETKSLFEEERVFYTRMSPRGKRNMTVFLDKLTPEQKKRVLEVEAFLLEVAEDASDETRIALKGK